MENYTKTFSIPDALMSLTPGAEWTLSGDEYEGLDWISDDIEKPLQEEVYAEIARLQEEYDLMSYQRKRSVEYPNFLDYIDGVVKGDQDQIDSYIAKCLAVKEKYPKPESLES